MDNKEAHIWAGQCLRKARFSSPKKAEKAIKRIANKSGDKLRSYLCNHCFGYHLTKDN